MIIDTLHVRGALACYLPIKYYGHRLMLPLLEKCVFEDILYAGPTSRHTLLTARLLGCGAVLNTPNERGWGVFRLLIKHRECIQRLHVVDARIVTPITRSTRDIHRRIPGSFHSYILLLFFG